MIIIQFCKQRFWNFYGLEVICQKSFSLEKTRKFKKKQKMILVNQIATVFIDWVLTIGFILSWFFVSKPNIQNYKYSMQLL